MAKNREPVKQPESDPSEESDSEGSDSDSEPPQIFVKKPPTSLKSPPPQQASSEDDEEEEEEDDSDSDSEVPDLKTMASEPSKPEEEEDDSDSDSEEPHTNVKPTASKSTPQKPVVSQSKPVASEPATTSRSKRPAKRPAEEKQLDEGRDSKKSRKKPVPESQNELLGAASDSSKKVLFQRIWSEDDEIAILKGMLNYFAKNKSKPTADLGAFHQFIKKDLHIEVKKEQLQAKIQKLKKRYETNKTKGKNLTKPHDQELFDLSDNYWGTEKGIGIAASPKTNGSVLKKMPKKKANIVENEEDDYDMMCEENTNDDLKENGLAPVRCSDRLTVDERVMRIGAELFEGVNGVEGYKEWKNLTIEEFEIHVKRLDMMRTRTELVLDYLKSKNH